MQIPKGRKNSWLIILSMRRYLVLRPIPTSCILTTKTSVKIMKRNGRFKRYFKGYVRRYKNWRGRRRRRLRNSVACRWSVESTRSYWSASRNESSTLGRGIGRRSRWSSIGWIARPTTFRICLFLCGFRRSINTISIPTKWPMNNCWSCNRKSEASVAVSRHKYYKNCHLSCCRIRNRTNVRFAYAGCSKARR